MTTIADIKDAHQATLVRFTTPAGSAFVQVHCTCGYRGDSAREHQPAGNPTVGGVSYDDMLPRLAMSDAEVVKYLTADGSYFDSHQRVQAIAAHLDPEQI